MTKREQKSENALVECIRNDLEKDMENGVQFISKLRTCNAEVLASNKYYILKSYRTIIACIDGNGQCYDFLRLVYGYTATSVQHISKFIRDYGNGDKFTWRDI